MQFVTETFELSQRRASGLIGVQRSSVRYVARSRPEDDALRQRLRFHSERRPRFGYRRLHGELEREGILVNHKRVHRLYKLEGLAVRPRKRRKIASQGRTPIARATRVHQHWALDFISDSLSSGRSFRILNVLDERSRLCLASELDTSLSGARVARVLEALASQHGLPEYLVLDNGPEFTSRALDEWAYRRRV